MIGVFEQHIDVARLIERTPAGQVPALPSQPGCWSAKANGRTVATTNQRAAFSDLPGVDSLLINTGS